MADIFEEVIETLDDMARTEDAFGHHASSDGFEKLARKLNEAAASVRKELDTIHRLCNGCICEDYYAVRKSVDSIRESACRAKSAINRD